MSPPKKYITLKALRKISLCHFLWIIMMGALLTSARLEAATVTVAFPHVKNQSAPIYVAMINNPQMWDKEVATNTAYRQVIFHPKAGQPEVRGDIETVEPGTYAIKVFQDVAGTGKLETDFFGIPTEPYGFSQNPDSFGLPTFSECAFDVTNAPLTLMIQLQNQ